MTKSEREELCKLIRRRERIEKTASEQRSAELLADFERQLASIYQWDQQEIWKAAKDAADKAAAEANVLIAARCRELGIPKEFAPGLTMGWHGRGENGFKDRRVELRRERLLIGLSAEQFQAACLYLAAYQKKHRDGLAVLRAGFECEVTDEPRAERSQ